MHKSDYGGMKPTKEMKKEAEKMHKKTAKKKPRFMMSEGGKVKVK